MDKSNECLCQERFDASIDIINAIIHDHKDQPDALIQILTKIQDLMGYIPRDVFPLLAERLGVAPSDIYGLVTLLPSGSDKPRGKHVISVCKGTSCYLRGSNEILDSISHELGVEPGDITKDGHFSVEVVRCVGACALGPVVTVDDAVHARIEPEKVPNLIKKYAK